jgi:Fe-S-cluster containining protein
VEERTGAPGSSDGVGPTGSTSVCIGCGLCCDGTVVGHLAVRDPSDLGAPLAALGVEMIVEADPPVFALPCPALADGTCTVHDLHRPHACSQFECSLSAAVRDGEVPAGDARAVIAETRARLAGTGGDRPVPAEVQALVERHFLPR